MRRPVIKVCGLRDPKNISDILALGVDRIGLVFVTESPRSFLPEGEIPAKRENAEMVGVFRSSPIDEIQRVAEI